MVYDGSNKGFPKTPGKGSVLKKSQKSKFEKQREEEVVRNAHERGYLRTPTANDIWDSIGEKCDLNDISYLNMSRICLHTVQTIDWCTRLRICVLHSNYISSFDSLATCRDLVFLDLHNNQITKLPGHKFWASLTELKVVFLHNNSISKLDDVNYMAASSSISILTLNDTPLSLKPNYRHHLVNSLWTLKSLDNYVISDEEIIEDSSFGGRFAPLRSSFYIDCSCSLTKENTYEEALKEVHRLTAEVNEIQAKYCPVLIIQRYIRGHLSRLRFKFIQDMRLWAAVSIQRYYRHYKGYTAGGTLPPPTSPAPSRSNSSLTRFDYETYLHGIKPGYPISPRASAGRIARRPRSRNVSITVEPISSIIEEGERRTEGRVTTSPVEDLEIPRKDSFPVRITTRISLNLRKLETSTSDVIRAKKEAVTIHKNLGLIDIKSRKSMIESRESMRIKLATRNDIRAKSRELQKEEQKIEDKEGKRKKPDRIGKYTTVRVFLGRVVDSQPRTECEPNDTEHEPKKQRFRLSGLRPPIQKTDPLREMLISKQEAGKDVREAAREIEKRAAEEPKKVVTKRQTVTTDQRLFIRTHGTMGLACLRAVQHAYRERERADTVSSKAITVAQMREDREQAKERVKVFKQEYKEASLRRRVRDGVRTAEALKERQAKEVIEHERLSTARAVTAEQLKSRRADWAFISDFNCQHTSISNALQRHDRASQRDERVQEIEDTVRKGKEVSQDQQALVRRYMEHRQLLRQAETAMARAELDAHLTREASQRKAAAKERVAQIKARNQDTQEFYSPPVTHAPARLPPLAVVSPVQMDVWNDLEKFEWTPASHERCFSEPYGRVVSSRRQRMYSLEPTYGIA